MRPLISQRHSCIAKLYRVYTKYPSSFSPCFLMSSKRKLDASSDPFCTQRPSQIRKMATQPATATISLSPKEDQLKELLLDVARYVDQSQPAAAEPVVLRWAGGWVRDKLLGIDSHDIDTAINVMTGEAFALKICELCEKPETIEKHRITETDIGNLHKIAKNPDKSKHLETTTIKLFGYDVDFVNLRKETYTEDSRNPQMEFGTAEEDALRRDATINALFFNLNTGEVEDFTTGLADMKSRLIRTPLEPFQTFMDDPLRVLRLIRFASRLEFTIDKAAEKVMGHHRVLDALRLKISRERVGVEVEKMLKGNDPWIPLEYINEFGLYHTIFTDPNNTNFPSPDLTHWTGAYITLYSLKTQKALGSIYDVLVRSDEAAYFAWVLSAIAPFGTVEQPPHKGKGKPPLPYGTLAAREGIKVPNKLSDVCTAAYNHRKEILSIKDAVLHKTKVEKRPLDMEDRAKIGMAIRRWEARGDHWRLQVLSALLVDAMEDISPRSSAFEEFLKGWQTFINKLQELDVMEAPSLKRIIDGTQLAKALGVKPGKWMAQALDVCVAWQLRYPETTDPAGAVEEVDSKRDELGIPAR